VTIATGMYSHLPSTVQPVVWVAVWLQTLSFFRDFYAQCCQESFIAAEAGQATLVGLLDLAASFDTVNHAILIERYGWRHGRTQYV